MTERKCEDCGKTLLTQAGNTRCRKHRNAEHFHPADAGLNMMLEPFGFGFAGRCCGDPECRYWERRP